LKYNAHSPFVLVAGQSDVTSDSVMVVVSALPMEAFVLDKWSIFQSEI